MQPVAMPGAVTLGTFISLALPQEPVKTTVEAVLSVPEGVWAFQYDITNSLVYATWTPSNNFQNSKPKRSKYRLRLWSGSDPQNGLEWYGRGGRI